MSAEELTILERMADLEQKVDPGRKQHVLCVHETWFQAEFVTTRAQIVPWCTTLFTTFATRQLAYIAFTNETLLLFDGEELQQVALGKHCRWYIRWLRL